MADTPIEYDETTRFTNTNVLYGNHFKFFLQALPDLSFFVQHVTLPSVLSPTAKRANPFTTIPEVGDHLSYNALTLSFLIDAEFKTYTSLYWWMKGYGFPHSYDEVVAFREARARQLANPRPIVRELEKTHAMLSVLQPDTERIIVNIRFTDIFPTQLGEMSFETTDGDAPILKTSATFEFTDFDIFPA